MSEPIDRMIEEWRCCTGGALGVRRVAHSPRGSTVEFTKCAALAVARPLDGHHQTRIPTHVLAWLIAPLTLEVVKQEPQGAPSCTCGAYSEPDYSAGDHALDCPRAKPQGDPRCEVCDPGPCDPNEHTER